jgi:hypothetical protein
MRVLSPEDKGREKIRFYGQTGVPELLILDGSPWQLEMYRRQKGQLRRVGNSTPARGQVLASCLIPFTFRLVDSPQRPRVDVRDTESGRSWLV